MIAHEIIASNARKNHQGFGSTMGTVPEDHFRAVNLKNGTRYGQSQARARASLVVKKGSM